MTTTQFIHRLYLAGKFDRIADGFIEEIKGFLDFLDREMERN